MIPNTIVVHHSVSGPNTTLEQINAWHKARDFTRSSLGYYVGYHYVIFPNGSFTQTRRDGEMGCHTIPNDGKIGICLVGNFDEMEPTQQQIDSLETLLTGLKNDYNISGVFGHRDFSQTKCPGDNLYKVLLIDKIGWLKRMINILLNKPGNHV